jgi:uncharacterized protein (DUF302 family)
VEDDVIEETRYGLRTEVRAGFDETLQQTTAALQAEGFGVLTTIDVKETLKKKLDRDFRRYMILGACNPVLADRALHSELEIGLLLPCNVIVYEKAPGETAVAAMAPIAALGIIGENQALQEVAGDADARLRRALESLSRVPAR